MKIQSYRAVFKFQRSLDRLEIWRMTENPDTGEVVSNWQLVGSPLFTQAEQDSFMRLAQSFLEMGDENWIEPGKWINNQWYPIWLGC